MDVHTLRQFISSKPGTFGQHISRTMALNMVASGRIDAVAALVSLVGIEVIPVLIATGAPPEVRRAAINAAMFFHYRELPGLIEANGGRAVFADWCRGAGFEGSAGLPETVDIYRGTHGCSPAAAVTGLHWTLEFDKAAFYGAQYADADLTGVIVIHAKVARDDLVGFMTGGVASEVIPAAVPTTYETITDKDRIIEGAVRFSDCRQGLLAKGWKVIPTHGTAERVASEARARMQAAGVPRGTAIVA